ncbi:hypothetical protein IAQ61_001084 [Plenodomus lingam]|uniref:uncharacterized protein n=1 Tax=Leptosphaeria maculans TaxID=5022 RepID=UPI00331BC07D|nr:hypothetical protein IAQ61_001084 [Plenodomus lingam]
MTSALPADTTRDKGHPIDMNNAFTTSQVVAISTRCASEPQCTILRAASLLQRFRDSLLSTRADTIDTYRPMRLLYTASNGKLEWTEDLIEDIPPYAILSHTWEKHEVVFNSLKSLDNVEDIDAKWAASWRKIRFCAQQTERDGLQYFWIDTCCIDKSNNQELQGAINSMFCWYQNAQKCYVYLSDVESNAPDADSESSRRWKPAFRKSRWFRRGWTLQELLAPASVEFYSSDEELLGDKNSLKDTIHEITGVASDALLGKQLSEFSVQERFSWAKNRQTRYPEDEAYCLLGIFDIHLPLIYGEGKEHALKRLDKEIREPSAYVMRVQKNLGKIYSWLGAPDPSTNYHKADKQRQTGTGLWLLKSAKFKDWKESAASQLWLYGIPGCGKTILSSTVIKDLQQHCRNNVHMVTAYFYFDFNDIHKQDAELMLCSLLCQLVQSSVVVPESVDALFSSCNNGQRKPSANALLEVIQQVTKGFTQVYFVLDALDECAQRKELMDMLETVAGWQLGNVHLLITSRKERDIEGSLEVYIKEEETVCLQMDVVNKDIQRYVRQRLSDNKRLAKWNKNAATREEIETALMSGAHGMFQWVACQLDTLETCCNQTMLRKSLATLPRTLDQTYERILSAISDEYSEYAMRILRWLTFSARPLSVEEIAEVVAIDVARDPAFDRDEVLEDPLEALNICSSLVTITSNRAKRESSPVKQIITLAHFSVQEYLVSDRIKQGSAKQYSMQEVECHNVITTGCLKYLLQLQPPKSKIAVEQAALARYSAEFWSSHLRKVEYEMEDLCRLGIRLLDIKEPAFLTWLRLYNPEDPCTQPDLDRSLDSVPEPLYYASLLGLSTVTRLLVDKGANINAQGGNEGDALCAASSKGHKQDMAALYSQPQLWATSSQRYGSVLHAASWAGHEQVVKILLKAGANVNAQSQPYGSVLHAALLKG